MITVAIIGILAAIALPAYQSYSNKARFAEAILAVDDFRISILVGAQTGKFTALSDVDAGTNGVRPQIVQSNTAHGINVTDGAITVTWMSDGSSLANVNYILTAQGIVPPVQWVESGTCKASGYC
ncbi:MAG: pilus assembly protein TapA [Gammaproteobacteria bacterium]|nr:pilus assembly protein TapA [Gammaproteobacteria bacterium]